MPQAVDTTTDLGQVTQRLADLERRVAALEGHPENLASGQTEPAPSLTPLQRPKPPATWRGFPPAELPGGIVSALGKAVLGIAGAYLLRAIAESGTISKLPVLMVAVVYAALWMVWAVRTHDTSRFASVTYGITSALILSPLLWESTVRFQVVSPTFTAVVLVAFVVLALALAWQRNLQVIAWIATLATVITALALIIATHELVPLTAALLALALATEVAACFGHRLSMRAVPALAADFSVWLLIEVMTSSGGVPEGYQPSDPIILTFLAFVLLAVYGGSIGIRSFALRHRITIFEVVQGVLAFLVAAWGTLRATHDSAAPALGVLFLLLAAVNYWGALSRFADEHYSRNRRVSATWAAALLLAGTLLLFPASLQVPFLSLAALAAAFVYSRMRKFSLGLHTSFYLAAATAVSPLPMYVAQAFGGIVPAAPGWQLCIVAVSSVLCYIIGGRNTDDQGKRRLLWIVPAALVSFTAAALAVAAAVSLTAGRIELGASHLSVIRTMIDCALALALGFMGSRWKRIELGWVAYTAVAFGTLKLLFEDLRFGNAASLVVSLLFYGSILILLPRLAWRAQTKS
jgi:hypothetical protein